MNSARNKNNGRMSGRIKGPDDLGGLLFLLVIIGYVGAWAFDRITGIKSEWYIY